MSLSPISSGAAGAAAIPILLVHATGFHARCWDQVVGQLGAARVIAIDQRGHGRSDKVARVRWQEFGRDIAEFVRRLDLHDVVGVGHSAGGHAMVEAAALEGERFRRLVLIDPTILAPEYYVARGSADDGAWIEVAGNTHPGGEAAPLVRVDRRDDRAPARAAVVRGFTPAALRDYCTWGLLPCSDPPGFELACSPEMEGAVYSAAFGNPAIHEHVRAVTVPVRSSARWSRRPRRPRGLSLLADVAAARHSLPRRPRRPPSRPHALHADEDPALTASDILTSF